MIGNDRTVVRLELPVDARMVRVARLVVSGVAANAGFNVDEIDDLRLAVDEMCAVLLELGAGKPLNLAFAVEDARVEVAGNTAARSQPLDMSRYTLTEQILTAACDAHSLDVDGGIAQFTLSKQH
jgi:serine/threonine-protein kinase RsbW